MSGGGDMSKSRFSVLCAGVSLPFFLIAGVFQGPFGPLETAIRVFLAVSFVTLVLLVFTSPKLLRPSMQPERGTSEDENTSRRENYADR